MDQGSLHFAARIAHILGVVLWIGGIVTVAMLGAMAKSADESAQPGFFAAARAVARRVVTPGMGIAWLAGLAVLVPNFAESYARAGWMHGKLTLALVLTALTGIVTAKLRKGAEDVTKAAPARTFQVFATVIVILTLIVISLVKIQPGA